MADTERNKQIVLQMYEQMLYRRDLDTLSDFFTSDVRYHGGADETFAGVAAVRDFVQADLDAFPTWR